MTRSKSILTNRHRPYVLALMVFILSSVQTITAQPVDPFTGATPSFDAAPEEGTNYNLGDWGVSDQNGAVTYTVPIDVPPGRNDMAPSLSLRYSSNSPLRGGLAVGWTFDVPSIKADLTLGAAEGARYKIDLGSISGRLVEVQDASPYPGSTAYRVQFDNSNTRIFRVGATQLDHSSGEWVALTPDGIRHHFERAPGSHSEGVWNITRQVDTFGNTVLYKWVPLTKNESIYLGQSLDSIEYSGNAGAGLVPHTRIEFDYSPLEFCGVSDIPIGAAYRKGSKQVTGAQSLKAIRVFVRDTQTSAWSLRKQVDLSYQQRTSILYEVSAVFVDESSSTDTASAGPGAGNSTTEAPEVLGATTSSGSTGRAVTCGQNPLRYLTQIEVKAFDMNGVATVAAPISFEYNARQDLSRPLLSGQDHPMRTVTVSVPGFGQEGISGPRLGGLQVTLLDIDNDGVRDRVSVIEENRVCTLVWTKGLRGGSFEELERKSPLPTAAWYREWRGIDGPLLDGNEGCTLSGQVAYRSVPAVSANSGVWPPNVLAKGILSYEFMDYTGDGRVDLITNVWTSSTCFWTYDPWATPIANDPVCSFDGGPQAAVGEASPLEPERLNGRFLWRVYPGTGNPAQPFLRQELLDSGTAQFPLKVRSPINRPLPASEAALDLSTVTHYSVPTLFDIDGDGFLDVIDTEGTTLAPCTNELLLREGCDWTVYLGDGTGSFPETSDAHLWEVPEATLDSDNWEKEGCDADFLLRRATVIGLRDLEGDGLADLVVRLADHRLYSYRNTGSGFDSLARPLNSDTPLEQVQTDCEGVVLGDSLRNGHRGFQRRLLDLDADGLLDMIWFEGDISIASTTKVKAKFNMGDRFGDPVTILFPENWAFAKRLFSAEWESDEFQGKWNIVNDFEDVDGDGLADLVQWDVERPEVGATLGSRMSFVSSPGLPSAPDMLRRVTNGRGMVVTFSYAPSTDRDVVDWTGSESTMPTPRWVVSKSIVDSGFGTPPTATQYAYRGPTYSSAGAHSGTRERSQFVGFSQASQTIAYTNGTSQQVHSQYEYEGLHSDVISIRTLRDGQLHRAVRKEWLHETIFDESIHLALPALTASCNTDAPSMSVSACFSVRDNVQRNENTWRFSGAVRQFLNVQSREGFGAIAEPGDRKTDFLYANLYDTQSDPEDYRIRVRESVKSVGDDGGSPVATGRTVMQFDSDTGLVSEVRKFSNAQTSGATLYTHDAQTGNVLSVQKPLQNDTFGPDSGPKTSYRYDSHQLFPEETANELGQRTRTTFDVSTGVLRKREGPNFLSIAAAPVFDTERWQLDGFGRVLSRSISIDSEVDNNPTYEERVVERFVYDDMNFVDSGLPISLRVEQLRDFEGAHFIPIEQDFDGQGRMLATRQLFEGDMHTLATYSYADSGGIQSVETVDPRDNSERITFMYRHDGVGRVTEFTRPDSTGTSIDYVGLDQTISEIAPDGSGGSKSKKFDAFGRLVELQEHEPGGAAAVTRYEYDANDNLSRITDAEGNVTRMNHDFLGNRVEVIRGERHWQYRHDLNGNLVSKQSPVPVGADVAHYQTAFTYDALDRMLTQRFVDMRLSSPPASSAFTNTLDEDGFAPTIETIRYHYDQAQNGIGRLRQVELPFGWIDYSYDVRGLVIREQRSLVLDGLATLNATQHVTRGYNALGQLTSSHWQDGQQWRISYDERGSVGTVDWLDPQDSVWRSVADYDREMTGLPETRRTAFGQTRSYTYDALARPKTDVLTLDGLSTALAERSYDYTDAGDLAGVVGQTNGVSASALYVYDAHHRLLSADGPNEYRGSFTYSTTSNVLSAEVTWNGASQTRNVNYSYGLLDPQAVDELQDASTGDTFAAFAYDDAGNMTWRSTTEGDALLHWDGRDQLRSADTGHGIETYYYDHLGQRTLVVDAGGGVRVWFGERETHFGQDGAESLNYLHLSGGGPTLARIENRTDIELQYADALQNLMFSLNRIGDVKSSFLYGPFGEIVFETGGDEHRRQFNGKEGDVATGLRYYGFRYYDPITLRWNSADPLYNFLPELGSNEPKRMNLYAFSLNNPVRYYDPDGRASKDDDDKGDAPEPDGCESRVDGKCVDDDAEPVNDEPSRKDQTKDWAHQLRELIKACQDVECVNTVIDRAAAQLSSRMSALSYEEVHQAVAGALRTQIDKRIQEVRLASLGRGVREPSGPNAHVGRRPPHAAIPVIEVPSHNLGIVGRVYLPGSHTENFLHNVVRKIEPKDDSLGEALKATGMSILAVPAIMVGTPFNRLRDTFD